MQASEIEDLNTGFDDGGGITPQDTKTGGSKKKGKKGFKGFIKNKKALKSILIITLSFLLGLVWILNMQPYLSAAQNLWGVAGDRNTNTGVIGNLVFASMLTSWLWTLFGISLCVGLQLLEFLPALNWNINRKKSRMARMTSYLVDLIVLWSVYPITTLPPNWWHLILMLLALVAVEFIFYPLVLIKDS
jgi:hypothetical protein